MRLSEIKKAAALAGELAALDHQIAAIETGTMTLSVTPASGQALTIELSAGYVRETKARLRKQLAADRDAITDALAALGVETETQQET